MRSLLCGRALDTLQGCAARRSRPEVLIADLSYRNVVFVEQGNAEPAAIEPVAGRHTDVIGYF
jgi:hypothetical protein